MHPSRCTLHPLFLPFLLWMRSFNTVTKRREYRLVQTAISSAIYKIVSEVNTSTRHGTFGAELNAPANAGTCSQAP